MKGIPASTGIAIGRVWRFEEVELKIETCCVSDTTEEVGRLEKAARSSIEQIEYLMELLNKKGMEKEAAVFEAHTMIFEDPEWIGRMKSLIKSDNVNAEVAVERVSAEFTAIFEAMDDPYLKERAADIKDVSGRLLRNLLGIQQPDLMAMKEPVILVAADLKPSDTAQLDKNMVLGFITQQGNKTSHTAIIARTLGIPAIVGATEALTIEEGVTVALNGDTGEVFVNPNEEKISELKEKKIVEEAKREGLKALIGQVSQTIDGYKVELAGNIGRPTDVPAVLAQDGEGIGLFRSEFLFMDRPDAPTEEEQYGAYKSAAENMGGKPVVIRTLDAGGDKNIPYLNTTVEDNPFLGYRAIRICLDDIALFKTQLRAILRASAHGKVRIMFPMIANLSEWRRARALTLEVMEELKGAHIPFDSEIQLGIMVEIPSAAVLAERFAKEVDFFSIGTNDLTQYTLAADRMNEKLSHICTAYDPAVLQLIQMVIEAGKKHGKWVGMCGEAAGDPKMTALLIGLGLEEFSMAPGSILPVRQIVRKLDRSQASERAQQVMALNTAQEIEEALQQWMTEVLNG